MAIWSEIRIGQFSDDDHWEDGPDFSIFSQNGDDWKYSDVIISQSNNKFKALNGNQLTKSNMFLLMNHFILLIPKLLHIMMKDSKRMDLIESVKFAKCT